MRFSEVLVEQEPQALFDHVIKSLALQGKKALEMPGLCAYENEAGDRCAGGWCFTPEVLARVKGSAARIYGLCDDLDIAIAIEDVTLLHLVQDLQLAHDNAHGRSELFGRLVTVAITHGLKPDQLETSMSLTWQSLGGW